MKSICLNTFGGNLHMFCFIGCIHYDPNGSKRNATCICPIETLVFIVKPFLGVNRFLCKTCWTYDYTPGVSTK